MKKVQRQQREKQHEAHLKRIKGMKTTMNTHLDVKLIPTKPLDAPTRRRALFLENAANLRQENFHMAKRIVDINAKTYQNAELFDRRRERKSGVPFRASPTKPGQTATGTQLQSSPERDRGGIVDMAANAVGAADGVADSQDVIHFQKVQNQRLLDVAVVVDLFVNDFHVFAVDITDGTKYELVIGVQDVVQTLHAGLPVMDDESNIRTWIMLVVSGISLPQTYEFSFRTGAGTHRLYQTNSINS
jgi:hypothetical protein